MAVVMKFGGTSVADAPAFDNVARIVAERIQLRPVVVVSAMSGMTDALVTSADLAQSGDADAAVSSLIALFDRHRTVASALLEPESEREFLDRLQAVADQISELLLNLKDDPANRSQLKDELLSFGEQLSSELLARVLPRHGVPSTTVDARDCIITNDEHGCASPVLTETVLRSQSILHPVLDSGVVPVVGGFFAATRSGLTTTLGRGGSDYTAAILGAALNCEEIQIWTDVTGVLTADPRVVPQAQTVERLSYGEAAELAYFGAKVLHPKTIQPAIEKNIPVRICNSHMPAESGTLVCAQTETSPRTLKAIAHKTGVTTVQITSARMLGAYGFLRALFAVFERHRTVVDVVTTSEVSVSLSLDDATSLPAILADLKPLGTVGVEPGRAIICVVGEGLRGTPGIAARVFSTISDINVTLISQGASSINFTFAIEEERVHEAVRRLHREFFEQETVPHMADERELVSDIHG
ncbi:MAG TPA: lysine-sensitive aspartokinase 3 [Pyrinomonadaceae bacterium]|jgi:aspartate kinase